LKKKVSNCADFCDSNYKDSLAKMVSRFYCTENVRVKAYSPSPSLQNLDFSLIVRSKCLLLETNLLEKAARGGDVTVAALLKDAQDVLPHSSGLLAGVNASPDLGLLVVVDDGRGLVVVGSQTLLEGGLVVVGTLDEGLASDVVGHGLLGRVEDLVVRATGSGVDETAGDTRDEQLVVDAELNGVLERLLAGLEHVVEALGLGDSAREAVKNEAGLALGVVLELALDHANHDLVADETALVHDLLGLSTQLGLLCDLSAEHVTGSLRAC
jgi:hypothetical protein